MSKKYVRKLVAGNDPSPEDEGKKVITIGEALGEITKTFKKINPDIISDPKKIVQFISSGDYPFDLVNNGGYPRRRITEIFGMEHSGKSSLLYKSFADLQRKKGLGILLDYEGSWEPQYAKRTFGLVEDQETFVVFQPDTVEEGDKLYEILNQLLQVDLLVVDSVDAMKPQALIECALDKDAKIGAHAMAVGKVVSKFRRFARFKNCAIVFTNQIRSKININQSVQNQGTGAGFNVMEPYTTPGGWALRFYASLRVKLEFAAQLRDKLGINAISGETEEIRIGNMIRIINVKNKVGPPMRKFVTHYDFPSQTERGGWNEVKDIMYILKKRRRLYQVKGKLTYKGLKIEEWTYNGSKVECEKAFSSDKKLVKDGRDLVLSLMNSNKDILDRVSLNELDPDDVAYQDKLHPDIKKEEIDALDLQDEEDDPVKNISL